MRRWLLATMLSALVATGLIIGAIAALPTPEDSSWSDRASAMATQVTHLRFGASDAAKSDVVPAAAAAMTRSLTTIGLTLVLVLVVGFPIGIASAMRPYSALVATLRRAIDSISGLPVLVWALIVLLMSSKWLHMTMDGSVHPVAALFASAIVLALGDHLLSDITRRVENGTREILQEPFMRTARAARLGERRHLLQGLVTPIAGLIASRGVFLISAAIVAEYVFNSRGLGFWVVTVMSSGDPGERSLLLACSLALTLIALAFRFAEKVAVALADRRTLR